MRSLELIRKYCKLFGCGLAACIMRSCQAQLPSELLNLLRRFVQGAWALRQGTVGCWYAPVTLLPLFFQLKVRFFPCHTSITSNARQQYSYEARYTDIQHQRYNNMNGRREPASRSVNIISKRESISCGSQTRLHHLLVCCLQLHPALLMFFYSGDIHSGQAQP